MKYYCVHCQGGHDSYFKGARAAMISAAPPNFKIPATEQECDDFLKSSWILGPNIIYEITEDEFCAEGGAK